MINKEVASPIVVAEVVAVGVPPVLGRVEITMPVVLADEIFHATHSVAIIISWD